MATSSVPWTRIAIFVVILAALGWWLYARDRGSGEEPAPTLPADGVGRPAIQDDQVVVDVLAYETKEDERPAYWIRLGNDAWDVELPLPATSEAERARLERRRADVFDDLKEELSDLRREAIEDHQVDLKGKIRRSAAVPADLYTQVFRTFIEAGYGLVDMVQSEGRPPGPLPR